jgi:hypothetical protein
MTNTKFSSFYLHTNENQVGDRKRDTVTTYHMILRPTSVMYDEKRKFLCEYNRMTKTATFRNEKGQIIEVPKMSNKQITDWVFAMAQQVFQSAQ